jgi:hypothetical protein
MSDYIKVEEIEEGAINETPSFYQSLSGNPLVELLKGRQQAEKFLRFAERRVFDVAVAERETIAVPFPPFSLTVAGVTNFEFEHKKSSPVFPFVYSPLIETLVATSGVSADAEKVYIDISNYNTEAKTVKLVVYLYELIN